MGFDLFSDLRILDLTRVFSGPFATRHFSDFGACVMKVEPPAGDDSRSFQPIINNWSGYFELLNRNKKSITLDLKQSKDLEVFYSLCRESDVLVENYTPDVKYRLKIDYQVIKQINPKIIYASISGVSENVDRKYYDVIAQAESGLISLNGKDCDMKIATSVVDAFAGMKLAYAISSALYRRELTGEGLSLNVSMKGSAFDLLEQNLIEASITHENPRKIGNGDSAVAPFGVFCTKDSSIVLAIGNASQWENFCSFVKEHDYLLSYELVKDNVSRIQNLPQLTQEIETIFRNFNTDDLIKILTQFQIPCAKVKSMIDVLKDKENYNEHLLERVTLDGVGNIVVPTGGIFFKNYSKVPYRRAPKLEISKP